MHKPPRFSSVAEICHFYARKNPDRPAIRYKRGGQWFTITRGQLWQTALLLANALKKKGFQEGCKGAVFATNRPEWVLFDVAIQILRGASVPIYMSSTGSQAGYIIRHSESVALFVDDRDRLEKVLAQAADLTGVTTIVTLEDYGMADPRIVLFQALLKETNAPGSDQIAEWLKPPPPETLASIVFTSGTTGTPKGVMITLGSFMHNLSLMDEVFPEITEEDVGFSYLPLAHVAQRGADLLALFKGASIGMAEDVHLFPEYIKEIKPTYFVAVPRVLEKVQTKVFSQVSLKPAVAQKIFGWAMDVAERYAKEQTSRGAVPYTLQVQWDIAHKLVYQKIKDGLGGRVRFILCGGAPTAPALGWFFHGLGIPVLEAYGLTETSALITMGVPTAFKYGTVNKPLPGGQVKIAKDGEILFKGPNLFTGYYKDPEATAEAFTEDGWFRTGDIGSLDEEGYLSITGRKKELLVTSGGKNVAPAPIEAEIKKLPFVSQAVVIGEGRHYLTALITLEEEAVRDSIKEWGLPLAPGQSPARHPEFQRRVAEWMEVVNGDLPSYLTIKKYTILEEDFTVDGGEITPTLKVKRNVVEKRFEKEIAAMYEGG